MLQQTQAASVVPYFERWLARFPDVASLAASPLDDVLKAWEGLGYYARARHLHEAARQLVAENAGKVPADQGALLRLPGIGRSTCGAILSLAFGRPEPVLDGNVRRVLWRVYDCAAYPREIAADPRSAATERQLWQLSGALAAAAPQGQAGDVNEALMDLGALVCTPRQPACPACPLGSRCLAQARGAQTERPVPARRAPIPRYHGVAAVIEDGRGRYLMARRPAQGLLGGLWEFPGLRAGLPEEAEPDVQALAALLARSVEASLGIAVVPAAAPLVRVRHAYTHFRLTLYAFRCTTRERAAPAHDLILLDPAGGCQEKRGAERYGEEPSSPSPWPSFAYQTGRGSYTEARWASCQDLASLALPTTDRKIAEALGCRHNQE
jgi:A/G-specific adenine glycosylase